MKLRIAALNRGLARVGVKEEPPGSNRGRWIDRWNLQAAGVTGVFWCMSFVHAMYAALGFTLPGGASVGAMLTAAREKYWLVARPRRGDLVCFGWNSPTAFPGDHVGFVKRVLALRWSGGKFTGWIETVEGNTSAQGDPSGSQSNGGGVFIRRRWVRGINASFVRVPGNVT